MDKRAIELLVTELNGIINDLSEVSNMGEMNFQQDDDMGAVSRLKKIRADLQSPDASTKIHGSGTGKDDD